MRFNDLLKLLYLVDTWPRDLLHTRFLAGICLYVCVFVNKCFWFLLKSRFNINPFAKLLCKVSLRGSENFGRPSTICNALLQRQYKKVFRPILFKPGATYQQLLLPMLVSDTVLSNWAFRFFIQRLDCCVLRKNRQRKCMV